MPKHEHQKKSKLAPRPSGNVNGNSSESGKQPHSVHVDDKVDDTFVEAAVRREATQQYEQALFEWKQDPGDSGMEICPQPRDGDAMDAIQRQYGHDVPSSASPLERWATLSVSNAEFPLQAKICMEELGITTASLESIKIRARAAKAITSCVRRGSKP